MKIRLDKLLIERQLATSLKQARGIICAGEVIVDDNSSDKPGNLHSPEAQIRLRQKCQYVSRGGLKLKKALVSFKMNVTDLICADIGASSGGFSDCLLQNGAARIYAVDVAYGQFSWKLRNNPRIVVIERFNARKITKKEIPEPLDLAVIDASFISVTKLLQPLLPLFHTRVNIIALIKPQFELPRDKIGPGGVVESSQLHQLAIDSVHDYASGLGLHNKEVAQSPILGPKGNKEFFVHLTADN